MNLELIKLLFSSSIYSFTPLLEKTILKTLAKDVYILIKYTMRFFSLISYNFIFNRHVSIMEHVNKIKSVVPYLIAATIVAFSSQYLYLDALKSMDISLVEPIGNVLINIFSVGIGVFFLKEELNAKKVMGVALGVLSIVLLTS